MEPFPKKIFDEMNINALRVLDTLGQNEELEYEIRFRGMSNPLTNNDFIRIRNDFKSVSKDYSYEEDLVEIYSDVRRIKKDGEIIYNKKISSFLLLNNNYNIKYNISREMIIDSPKIFNPYLFRNRKRHSYKLLAGLVRIDLTEILTKNIISGGEQEKKDYEIELEVLDIKNIDYEKLSNIINNVMYIIHGTVHLYTESIKNNTINIFNMMMSDDKKIKKKTNFYDSRLLSKARTLKFDDLVNGGMAGGNVMYRATPKTDGIRRLLMILNKMVFLITPPNHLNLLGSVDTDEFNGYILDGEDVPVENRISKKLKSIRHFYIIFDCCSINSNYSDIGDSSVRKLGHRERMEHALKCKKYLDEFFNKKILLIATKTFFDITNTDKFYSSTNLILKALDSLAYKTDGVIYVPDNYEYLLKTNVDASYRNLVNFPEIVKIKFRDDLTTDFVPDVFNKRLLVSKDGLVEFPKNVSVDWDNNLLKEINDETVVEFRWNSLNKIYIPVRIRTDKEYPNSLFVANDNFFQLEKGFCLDDILNPNLKLVRKYHNRIKKALFEDAVSIVRKNKSSDDLLLLDIGSGRGGDISKWNNLFDKVVAVEPNPDHIVEFNSRLDNSNMKNKVTIIQESGENYEEITNAMNGQKADVISFMLSLSFFWTGNKLEKLARTIKNNLKDEGIIIFLTINGDAINSISKDKIKKLDIEDGNIVFDFSESDDNSYEIQIKDTIVETQREYKVFISELINYIKPMKLKSHYIADKENFLTLGSKMYSKLYSYGYISL